MLKYNVDQHGFVQVSPPGLPVVSAVVAQPVRETASESSILSEADAIAGQSRSRDYGHPLDNHQRIADVWTVQAANILKPGERFTPQMVALMMIGLKLARLVNSPSHRDSMIDVVGYAKCWDMIEQVCDRPKP